MTQPKLSRDIGLLAASALTVMAGATIAPAIPSMQQHFADVPNIELLSKLVLTVPALLIAVTAPLLGGVADRVGHRTWLVIACLLYGVAGASGLILSSFTAILIGRAILGVSVGGIMTSSTALVAQYFDVDKRVAFLGKQAATASFGGLVFLTLGGAMAEFGWRIPFGIYLMAIPIGVYLAIVLEKNSNADLGGQAIVSDNEDDWKSVWTASAIGFAGMLAFYMVPTQLPSHLAEVMSTSPTQSGLAIGLSTLVGGIVSMLNRRIRKVVGFATAMALSFGLLGAGYAMVGVAQQIWLVLLAMSVSGMGVGLLMPNLTALVISRVAQSRAGSAVGLLTSSLFMGQFLSPIAIAPLMAKLSSSQTFLVVGGSLMILAIGVRLVIARHRTQPKPGDCPPLATDSTVGTISSVYKTLSPRSSDSDD